MRLPLIAAMMLLAATPALADQASALAAVRDTPRVIDARVDGSGTLYAFVKADAKVPWPQFADYLCKVVVPHQGRIFKVRVVDVTAANYSQPPANWPKLGEATCGR